MAASPSGRDRLGLPSNAPAAEAPAPAKRAEAASVRVASALPPAHVVDVIASRCGMCHAAEPVWDGVQIAPKNVRFDTPDEIAREADAIRVQAVLSHAMPPNNVTEITPAERQVLAAWLLP